VSAAPQGPRDRAGAAVIPEGSAAGDLAAVLAIARKDLLQEARSRAVTVATLFFSAVTLVMMAFAMGQDAELLRRSAPGVLWVALAFAGVITAAQSFQSDLEEGAFDQLLLYPVPRASVFLGKLLANWLYLAVLGLIMTPVTLVLYGARAGSDLWLLPVTLALGTFGFAVVATFYAALTANLQAREALLPVLMFPVVVPVLLGAVRSTEALVGLQNATLAGGWLQLLAGFDLVYFVTCTAIFHLVVEE
jgi:heme exporter protein B